MTPELVILRIQSVLSGKSDISTLQQRSLAAEYKGMCDLASSKLESCAALIRAGRDYVAMQIAETSPQLLDLINALSFKEYDQWIKFCKSEDFPVPSVFDEIQIELLNSIYAKQITQAHPLYRDFRRAVRQRSTFEALCIIRTICKINSNDTQARRELDKLSKKFTLENLAELKKAFAKNDESKIIELCRILKDFQTYISDDETWTKVHSKIAEFEARAEQKRIQEILETLHNRDNLDCNTILSLASEFQILTSSKPDSVNEEDSKFVDEASAMAAEDYDRKTAEQEAIKARNQIIIELEGTGKFSSNAKNLDYLKSLGKIAKDHLNATEYKRLNRRISSLKSAILRGRLFTFAVLVTICSLAGLAFWSLTQERSNRDRNLNAQMQFESALKIRNISDYETALENFEDKYSDILATDPSIQIKLDSAKQAIKPTKEAVESLNKSMEELSAFDFASSSSARWQGAFDKLSEIKTQSAKLEENFDLGLTAKANELSRLFQIKIDDKRSEIKNRLSEGFEQASAIVKELETMPADYAPLENKLQSTLAALKPYVEDTSALFRLHAFDVEKFNSLTAELASISSRFKDFEQQKNALLLSVSLSDYFQKLSDYSKSSNVRADLSAKMNAMVSKKDLFTNAMFNGICTLEAAELATEKPSFIKNPDIFNLPIFTNIWSYMKNGKPAFTNGKVEEKKSSWDGGNSEIIQRAEEITLGGNIKVNIYRLVQVSGKLPKGDLLTRETFSPESAFIKSLLEKDGAKPLISLISKIANAKINPLFKLRLEQMIFSQLSDDKIKSGLAYSGKAQERMLKVEELSKGLQNWSWMFELPSKANLVENELYKTELADFYPEAMANCKVAAALIKNPMKIAGFADENSKPKFAKEQTGSVWGIDDEDGEYKKLGQDNKLSKKPAPYTPLLLEKISREKLFEIANKEIN